MNQNTIVNHMLSVIGESGVSALDTEHPSVQSAKRILESENQDFQGRCWWFNTEYRLKLVPNPAGQVTVPTNTLEFLMADVPRMSPAEKLRYVRRGQYIYDTYEHTNKIGKPLFVDLVLLLAVEDLPRVASSFLKHKAAEALYVAEDGDAFKVSKLENNRAEAWQQLKAVELKTLGANALDNPINRALQMRLNRVPSPLLGGGQR